jgi:hypothetical protein
VEVKRLVARVGQAEQALAGVQGRASDSSAVRIKSLGAVYTHLIILTGTERVSR